MSKRYTASELKEILSLVMSHGFASLSSLAQELDKLSLTHSDFENPGDKLADVNKAKLLVNTITLIADIIHPAYNVSLKLFPEKNNKEFIKQCMEQHKVAIEKGIVDPNCPCCKKNIDPMDFSEAQ